MYASRPTSVTSAVWPCALPLPWEHSHTLPSPPPTTISFHHALCTLVGQIKVLAHRAALASTLQDGLTPNASKRRRGRSDSTQAALPEPASAPHSECPASLKPSPQKHVYVSRRGCQWFKLGHPDCVQSGWNPTRMSGQGNMKFSRPSICNKESCRSHFERLHLVVGGLAGMEAEVEGINLLVHQPGGGERAQRQAGDVSHDGGGRVPVGVWQGVALQ